MVLRRLVMERIDERVVDRANLGLEIDLAGGAVAVQHDVSPGVAVAQGRERRRRHDLVAERIGDAHDDS